MIPRTKGWAKLNSIILIFTLLFTTLGGSAWTPIANASEEQQKISKLPDPQRVELPQYRNETTKVYGNPDGTYTAEVFSEPVHYKEGDKWADIDNTLVPASDDDSLTNKKNKFSVKFPHNTQGKELTNLFDYSISGHDISVGLAGGQSDNLKSFSSPVQVQRTQEEEKVTYSNIYPGVKFEYVVAGSKVKENIILDSYQGKNAFEFVIQGTGLNAVKKENGYIEFTDKTSGKFLFNIPKPFMFDSNKENGPEGTLNMNVSQDIKEIKGGFLLTITADESFLKDPETVYPVTIDPWIDYFNAADTYIASGYDYNYSTQDRLYVGKDASIGVTRALVKWDTLPQIPNAAITDAKIGLMQAPDPFINVAPVNVHQVQSSYDVTQVKWSTPLSYKSTPEYTVSDITGNYNYFNVTDLVEYWYANPAQNHGVMFKYANADEAAYSRRTFHSTDWINPDGSPIGRPKLVITLMPKELLGITDYWHYTPDIFNGEGVGVVNVLNGNFVYDIPVLDIDSHADAFKLKMIYNNRSVYNNGWGYGWAFSGQRMLIPNSRIKPSCTLMPTAAIRRPWMKKAMSFTIIIPMAN